MRSILVLVAVAVIVASPAGAVGSAPVLRLTHGQPLTISGARFASNEHVTITVHARQPYLRRVVTNADGSFVVNFGVDRVRPLRRIDRRGDRLLG